MFSKIRKRNGHIVDFDKSKITRALMRAGEASGEFDAVIAENFASEFSTSLSKASVKTFRKWKASRTSWKKCYLPRPTRRPPKPT
jgi:hypothetical protein